jgi:hypothetical protein
VRHRIRYLPLLTTPRNQQPEPAEAAETPPDRAQEAGGRRGTRVGSPVPDRLSTGIRFDTSLGDQLADRRELTNARYVTSGAAAVLFAGAPRRIALQANLLF